MANEIATAGPAVVLATSPVSTKMPVPMITPTPKTVRSSAERFFLSRCSGSSVSRMESSTDFTRAVLPRAPCDPVTGHQSPLRRPPTTRRPLRAAWHGADGPHAYADHP